MTTKYLISVDPGINGAYAVFDLNNEDVLLVSNLPKGKDLNGNSVIDIMKLMAELKPYSTEGSIMVLEHIWARGTDTAKTAFGFGRTYQTIINAANLLSLKLITISPQSWKRYLEYSTLSKDEISEIIAKKHLNIDFKKKTGTWRHDQAEATAIGEWYFKARVMEDLEKILENLELNAKPKKRKKKKVTDKTKAEPKEKAKPRTRAKKVKEEVQLELTDLGEPV